MADSLSLAWFLKISIRNLIDRRVFSFAGAMFASALQILSPACSSAPVDVIVGWVGYLCLKNTVCPNRVIFFLGSKLHIADSVPMVSLRSSLSWCDFPTF